MAQPTLVDSVFDEQVNDKKVTLPVQVAAITASKAGHAIRKNTAKNTGKIFLGKSPGLAKLGLAAKAIEAGYDAYQGRQKAFEIWPDATTGQRAAAVANSITNGVTFGLANVNNEKDIRQTYDYWSNLFK